MKRILFVAALICAAAVSYAQDAESVQETYDLQKISKEIYRDYYYRIKNAVDSVMYHSGVDSLNCVVFDNVAIGADGTTSHQVKSNSDNEEVNRDVEEALACIKLPAIALYDEDGKGSPIGVTALFSIISNVNKVEYDFLFGVRGGVVTWKSDIPDILRGVLDKFADTAFYSEDSGNFRLKFNTFNVNSELIAFETFNVYKLTKKSEKIFIRYVGHQFTYFGQPFEKTKEQLDREREERKEYFTSAAFGKKDFNAFSPWVTSRLQYPSYARDWNITGIVDTQFLVDKDGDVRNVRIKKAVHPTLDREAFKVTSSSPKWTPATKDGEPVDMGFTHPVIFLLR